MFSFKKWLNANGWVARKIPGYFGMSFYGEYRGYIFTYRIVQKRKVVSSFLPNLSYQQLYDLDQYIKENKKRLRIDKYETLDNRICIYFKETFTSIKTKHLEALLQGISQVFDGMGMLKNGRCSFCSTLENTDLFTYKNTVITVCDSCLREFEARQREAEINSSYEKKNYFLGTVGAFIGGLIGAALWVLIAILLDSMFAALGFVMAYTALKGYTLFDGKIGKATKWIIATSTLLSVLAANIVLSGYALYDNGFEVSLYNFTVMYTRPDLAVGNIADLLMGLFLAAVGMASIYRKLKEEADNLIPSLERVAA
jgi:hypothetical protein